MGSFVGILAIRLYAWGRPDEFGAIGWVEWVSGGT